MGQERGQTLLEFAFVAPVLLVFVLALVDFGIAIDRRLVLDHAVREGARFASVGGNALDGDPADVAAVKAYTAGHSQGIADAGAPEGTNGAVNVCADGDGVNVSIEYTHDFVTGFTSIFDLSIGNIVMNPKAAARIEQPLEGTVDPC
ncbi:MAG: TadE/TadG family type IV pilus assembly protein [Dehalococcoidia bacterium]